MTTSEKFSAFIDNLKIDNEKQISDRYEEITRVLNKNYRDSESKTANSLQVGSYGRCTAIRGISDLDMIYMLSDDEWARFKDGRQSALLQEVKGVIKKRYSRTDIKGDGQVVVVSFDNQDVEVVPAFEQEDGSFKYPDTNEGGSWPITRPREEIQAISKKNGIKNNNLRPLCRMVRAWKNKHGVAMGGLLIDTLAYNFLDDTDDYDESSFGDYDVMVRDFFEYLSKQESQTYYFAPGSNQKVYVEKSFKRKAKNAYRLCCAAVDAGETASAQAKWKKIFGRPFPASSQKQVNAEARTWHDTEQFIEDKYPVDIRYSLDIDCEVKQNGFIEHMLQTMLARHLPLLPNKTLMFRVTECSVPQPYHLEWKVVNRGEEAEKRDKIRGEIVRDRGHGEKTETTNFRGEHEVECYAIRNGVAVARAHIDVPITTR
jgi:hypothetical protein